MKNTLIVPYDSNTMHNGKIISAAMASWLIFLSFICPQLKSHIGWHLVMALQALLLVLASFFVIGFILSIFFKTDSPAAILSPEGLWINNHGLIAWDKIAEMKTYKITGAPLYVVGVLLKDPASVSKQSSFSGKCVLFWAKLFGYQYHINLACIALSNSEVMAFAQQFLNKKI